MSMKCPLVAQINAVSFFFVYIFGNEKTMDDFFPFIPAMREKKVAVFYEEINESPLINEPRLYVSSFFSFFSFS